MGKDNLKPRSREEILGLSPTELVRYCEQTGERFVRNEYVLLDKIVSEAAVTDKEHAKALADEILLGKWGQTQTPLLRCRRGGMGVNDVSYDVCDGFHRIDGLRIRVPDYKERGLGIHSTILYGCSDEDMLDQRILAANSVKTVRFARQASWMKAAWAVSPWRDKITVTQAFSLAMNDSSGKIFGLSDEEARSIKLWTNKKAVRWLTPVGTIYQNLRTVEAADPDLVLMVRTGSFGKGQLALTPTQLEIIVEGFPLEYEKQKAIAKYSTHEGLSTQDLRMLVTSLTANNGATDAFDKNLKPGKWKGAGNRIYQASAPEQKMVSPSYKLGSFKQSLRSLRRNVEASELIDPNAKDFILESTLAILNHLKKLR